MNEQEGLEEAITTPIFTMPVLKHAEIISSKGCQTVVRQYSARRKVRARASSEAFRSASLRNWAPAGVGPLIWADLRREGPISAYVAARENARNGPV